MTSPTSPTTDPIDSQTIFAALRDVLAGLYPKEQDARVVVDDAGLGTTQIAFSSRAQTNWHNILAEALHQNRLDTLLQIVRAAYGDNPAFQAADGQYRQLIDQDGYIDPPAPLAADIGLIPSIETGGGSYIDGNVAVSQGDFVGRDKILHLGPLQLSRSGALLLVAGLIVVVILIGANALYTRGTFYAITAPTPTLTATMPTVTPTITPIPTATALAFATAAPGETLILVATFHVTTADNLEPHIKIRREIEATIKNLQESNIRVALASMELNADQRAEAKALGSQYNASIVTR